MLVRFTLSLALALTLAPRPGAAWGDAGHRLVCQVAWDELMETPLTRVKDLLQITTEQEFAHACTWADRHAEEHPETAAWHDVRIPKSAREIDMSRDCPEGRSCLLREIERNVEVLKNDAPREDRAAALKFLAHFVGDIHQPLRIGFAEDNGGADIPATFLGRETTMRAMWDADLVATDPAKLEALANTYHAYTPLDRLFVDWIAALPAEWATESLWIMRTPATGYVGNPGGLVFDDVYVAQNLSVAHDRIAKAGMRLGHLLNEVLR